MPSPTQLLARLDAIGAALARRPDAIALLGVGSVGVETARLDGWSDLDFFVIVEPAAKDAYIDDLAWLAEPAPIAWSFRNTPDGHKALYADGIFCEFAVFAPDELPGIAYEGDRVVWARDGVDLQPRPQRVCGKVDVRQVVDEALSNLYVGLLRWHRGERLAAMRMVQVFAVDRLLEVVDQQPAADGVTTDPWNRERRIEQRHPDWEDRIARCCQGIDRTPESALAMLDALCEVADLDNDMVTRIRALTGVSDSGL
jgi:hypothetical protein